MLAVAVPPPASMGPFTALTVIVNVWSVPTALVPVGGLISMLASTQVLLAGPLLPAGPSVVRVTVPSLVSGMFDVADTTVVPVPADVITTVPHATAPPPASLPILPPTKLPGPLLILAVAVPPAASMVPFTALTVRSEERRVGKACGSVGGLVWLLEWSQVFVAGLLLPAVSTVVRVTVRSVFE